MDGTRGARTGSLIVTLVAASALTGCGGGAEPKALDEGGSRTEQENTPDRTPTPTTTDTSLEGMPRDQLEPELEAFLVEFFEESDKAARTGDTSAARAMTTRACEPCWNPLDFVDDVYGSGGKIDQPAGYGKPKIDIRDVQGDIAVLDVRVNFGASDVEYGDDRPSEQFPAEEFYFALTIERNDSEFTITKGEDNS